MQMSLTKITLERITLEPIGVRHHGYGDDLPIYLL